jgi:FixJ family two-component response regulator
VIALTRVTGGSEVYLVDDDEGFLKALSRMLAAEGFHVRSYNSGRALLNDVAPGARGCVVADLAMPEIDGLRLQTALAESGCRMPVVFLTGAGDIPSTVRAMQGGAVDFLEKLAPKEQLLGAIRRAFERDTLETEQRAQQAERERRFAALTKREREVLREVVAGQMNKQIAARLGISERTVKMHRTAITHKVGVHSAAQLATLARDAGLFDAATS